MIFKGFHGTSSENAQEIINDSFKPSKGNDEWLGKGVYFFTDGLGNPQYQAKDWAIAEAWDKRAKRMKYSTFSIIESDISVDKERLIDLGTNEGQKLLSYIKEQFVNKLFSTGKAIKFVEGKLIDYVIGEKILPIEVVKGNVFIAFKKDRICKFRQRTPNCTICSVVDPSKNIKQSKLILTDEIPDLR
ncbi:MAG: hypothetical protein ACEPOV_10935 [Hyphomicrobiales bacterium]